MIALHAAIWTYTVICPATSKKIALENVAKHSKTALLSEFPDLKKMICSVHMRTCTENDPVPLPSLHIYKCICNLTIIIINT